MTRRNEPRLSAHAVATAARLLGPVDSQALRAEFTWSVEAGGHHRWILTGTPSDAALRLFCPQIRVELDRQTGLPQDWEVATRDGQWIAVKTPGPMPEEGTITLTGFETDATSSTVDVLPPAPSPRRLAVETERRPAVR